jgi:hypothetical protein
MEDAEVRKMRRGEERRGEGEGEGEGEEAGQAYRGIHSPARKVRGDAHDLWVVGHLRHDKGIPSRLADVRRKRWKEAGVLRRQSTAVQRPLVALLECVAISHVHRHPGVRVPKGGMTIGNRVIQRHSGMAWSPVSRFHVPPCYLQFRTGREVKCRGVVRG